LEKVLAGGHVLYLRHTETDEATNDSDLSDMSDCSKQRVLSETGRESARKIGQAVAALKIPVGSVITSRYCRAKETAALIGFEKAAESADIDNDKGGTKEDSDNRAAALQKMLATAPEPGKNTLIIGHAPNIRKAAGLDFADIKTGEIAIFTPKAGGDGYDFVARIKQDELLELASVTSSN
jgi:phosphohistidine phosphatase SixA